jgi:hypothetical protein
MEAILMGHVFNQSKVNDWSNAIVDGCLKGLQQVNKPFKYVGNPYFSLFLHTVSSSFSDLYHHAKDRGRLAHCRSLLLGHKAGWYIYYLVFIVSFHTQAGYCKIPWENSTMHCITTVFGMAILPSNHETL